MSDLLLGQMTRKIPNMCDEFPLTVAFKELAQ